MASTLTPVARSTQLFHALSDPTRLEILGRLRQGERCVCELTDALDAAQSRLSFHLKILREAGLVHDRKDGRWTHYSICTEALGEVEDLLKALKPRSLARSGAACCG